MKETSLCGSKYWYPEFLQRFANTKTFILVYGFLGTTQAMSYMYFIVTLTTLEKRFKIPSHTTGIVMSGNEISQIMLSLVLSYWGGQRNRPRWIAWGVVICGLSCFILAMPHFIYGAGEDALRLTKEYIVNEELIALLQNTTVSVKSYHKLCMSLIEDEECDELFSYVPLILIFLSQFILGIGNTLYYSLGQSYLDDNTKKTNTPLMLGYAFALRMLGPMVGFVLSYSFLNMYIDPSKTPIIDSSDPRWLGAWWLGWIVLGFAMFFFAFLIGLFPRNMPKKLKLVPVSEPETNEKYDENESDALMDVELQDPLNRQISTVSESVPNKPKLKDFPVALKRLLTNKLLMFNIMSGVFYILGSSGYITFLSKYIEVQFHKTRADSTIIAGPITLLGMVVGLLGSGWFIAKKKPHPSKLLGWNVLIGFVFIMGQISFLFLTCPDSSAPVIINGKLNVTQDCNAHCNCDAVPYTPVCNEKTGTTFFSACHAGCDSWDNKEHYFSNCSCLAGDRSFLPPQPYAQILDTDSLTTTTEEAPMSTEPFDVICSENTIERDRRDLIKKDGFVDKVESLMLIPGACVAGCSTGFLMFTIVSSVINCLGSSGKIGNILVNYRAVTVEDKSVSQGLMLMLISLLALIPGPILYGWIIDSTCLVWNYKCGKLGNCQIYDKRAFRLNINGAGLCLTAIGVMFDYLVWYHGRTLDLYSEDYEENNQKHNKSQKIVQKNGVHVK